MKYIPVGKMCLIVVNCQKKNRNGPKNRLYFSLYKTVFPLILGWILKGLNLIDIMWLLFRSFGKPVAMMQARFVTSVLHEHK